MSPALGFALVQPAFISLTVFAALGLGFALPFLLMALLPRARALLPKPGRWMETFRHLLAFPMFATALWLLWVLGRQAGVDALSLMLAAMIGLGFALMSWGRIQARQGTLRWSLSAAAGAAVAIAGAYLASSLASLPENPSDASAKSGKCVFGRQIGDIARRGRTSVCLLHRRLVYHLQGQRARGPAIGNRTSVLWGFRHRGVGWRLDERRPVNHQRTRTSRPLRRTAISLFQTQWQS